MREIIAFVWIVWALWNASIWFDRWYVFAVWVAAAVIGAIAILVKWP